MFWCVWCAGRKWTEPVCMHRVAQCTYSLVTCAKAYRGLRSLSFCSSVNTSCCWRTCMKNDSQQFILIIYCKFLVFLWFVPRLHILVCYLTCLRHKPKASCLFWFILYVLCIVRQSICQFGQHMNYCRCFILVYTSHLNLFCFVVFYRWVVLFVYGVCGSKSYVQVGMSK